MHYLVTGGAGFVGSHLVEQLVGKGHDVTVLDDMSNGNRDNLKAVKDRIRLVVAPVERADLLEWSEKFDGVFHLATHPRSFSLADPKKDIETNCKGMIAALEIARKHGAKVVFTSNSGIYGSYDGNKPINEETTDNPTTPYDANKLVSEYYCRIYHNIYGVRSCIVRFATVYGARQPVNEVLKWRPLVAGLLKHTLEDGAVTIYGDGDQTRDLLYVHDAVQGVLKAMDSKSNDADVFILSGNTETSVNQVLREIIRLTGLNPKVSHAPPAPGEIRRVRLDYSKAKRVLGYEPRYTLGDGLKDMLPVKIKA